MGSSFAAILARKLGPRTQEPHTQAVAADSKSTCNPPAMPSLTERMTTYKPILKIFEISSLAGHNMHVYTPDLYIDCSAIPGNH